MSWIHNRPIRTKLTLVSLLTCGISVFAVLLGCFALLIHLVQKTATHDLRALTEVLSATAAGPLAFRDEDAARTMLASLRVRTEIAEAWLLDASGAEIGRFTAGSPRATSAASAGTEPRIFDLMISQPVRLHGETIGQLGVRANLRGVIQQFALTAAGTFAGVFVIAMIIAWLVAARLQRTITRPLLALAKTARQVAANNDYTLRARQTGEDEVGRLTDAFNGMLAEVHQRDVALREAQEQLSEQVKALQHEVAERQRAEAELARTHQDLLELSRRAGQAEVATSVLHNVGNVLNSVIVSATVTIDRLKTSRVANVTLAGRMLEDHRDSLGPFFHEDPQGQVLAGYLPELGRSLEQERSEALTELESVRENIEHIKEIVATQQGYAKAIGVRENLQLVEVVEHALALNSDSVARHCVEVVRHYEELPMFSIDKHRVLQILVNLIRNAKDAMKVGCPPDQRRLELKVARQGDGWVRVEVADNGIGIKAENLTRIFQHGFTTRRDGHGFGLHSGALAAQQMGGRLTGQSPGEGGGARFILELPTDADR